MTEILRVSTRSAPTAVAGALAGLVRSGGVAEVQVVGAGALNQAIKALAIARTYVAPSGLDLHCRPTFADIEIDGQRRTAIRLLVEGDRAAVAPARPNPAGQVEHRAAPERGEILPPTLSEFPA